MARYDYDWRGYRETARAPRRRMGRPWHLRPGGDDPRDGWGWGDREAEEFHSRWRPAHRVTARYNRDYVRPRENEERYGVNYNPYGGDVRWRMGDFTDYERPYITKGGSYTHRGWRSLGRDHGDDWTRGPYRRGPGGRYGRDVW